MNENKKKKKKKITCAKIKQNPIDGMYNKRSATIEPTLKNKFVAAKNGNKNKVNEANKRDDVYLLAMKQATRMLIIVVYLRKC